MKHKTHNIDCFSNKKLFAAERIFNRLSFLIVMFLFFFLVEVKAQNPPVKQWEKTFGKTNGYGGFASDWALNIKKTSEGGYISCGFSTFDPSGPPTTPSLVSTIPSLVKLNAQGQTIWDANYSFGDNSAYGYFQQVIETSTGAYVAIGRKRNASGIDKICIVKTNKDGVILNQLFITPTGSSTSLGGGIVEIPSGGGYVISGTADQGVGTNSDAIVLKLDNSFNIVWQRRILGALSGRSFSVCLTYTGGTNPDGSGIGTLNGFATTGVQSNSPTQKDVFVAKITVSGTILWQTTVNSSTYPTSFYTYNETSPCSPATKNSLDEGKCVIQAQNGNIVVSAGFNRYDAPAACGPYGYYLECDGVLLKFNNSSGTLLLAKNISHFSGEDLGANIIQTNDNGFAINGSTADAGVLSGMEEDMLLVKTDINANVQWRRALSGTTGKSCGFGICLANDGGYALCGNNENDEDDYQYIKVYSDCQTNISYNQTLLQTGIGALALQGYHPYNGEVWSGLGTSSANWTINGEIVVDNGVTFTIQNSFIGFADSRQTNDYDYLAGNNFLPAGSNLPTKIIVKQGGKLVVDNSTLKGITACGSEYMWQGIEVWGTPAANQLGSNQGKVVLQNSAIIQNAILGVLLNQSNYNANGNPTSDAFANGGGILQASNSKFINCRKSVHFTSKS